MTSRPLFARFSLLAAAFMMLTAPASAAVITSFGDISLHTNSMNAGGGVDPGTVGADSVKLYSAIGQIGGAISGAGSETMWFAYIPTLYFDTAAIIDTTGPNIWYVNDTSTIGDSFTSAIGSDANNGLTPATPKRTITAVMSQLTSGDTVLVDAGTFTETVVINTNNVALVGKDSIATVIDPPGISSTVGLYGIYADTQTGLTIQSLGVTGANRGINLENVDVSTVSDVSVTFCGGGAVPGQCGISLYGGSDTNTISNNMVSSNTGFGLYLSYSSNNMLTSNTCSGNTFEGIRLTSSSNNTLTANTSSGNSSYGIAIEASSNSNTLMSNISSGNFSYGIALQNSSNNNTLTSNISSGNSGIGIQLAFTSNNNTLTSNTSSENSYYGIAIQASSNNTLTSNTVRNNSPGGFILYDAGGTGSIANTFIQNTSDSNAGWAFELGYIANPWSRDDTFVKNVIVTSPYTTYRDSGVKNSTLNRFEFTRNAWLRAGILTTDSLMIRGMLAGTGRDSIIYTPYRLGIVDTAPGADTTAPKAPDTVTATALTSTTIRIAWASVIALEEANGGVVGLAGYRVYRANTPDSTFWTLRGTTTSTTFVDSGIAAGNSKYYRVTSFDAATYVNESFFSDSIASATTLGTNSSGSNPGSITIGDSLAPVITDSDENRNSSLIETVSVTITNTVTGETEILVLYETDSNSGIFDVTRLPITGNASDSPSRTDTLYVRPGDTVTIRYVDANESTDSFTSSGILPRNATSISSGSFPANASVGDSIAPVITDADQNHDGSRIETVAVVIRNAATGETEILVLYETDSNSGVFDVTKLPVTNKAADSPSLTDTLYVRAGDTITITYTDPNDPTDTKQGTLMGVGTVTAPILPTALNRFETSATSIRFYWDTVTTGLAVTYRLQVATDTLFASLVLDTTLLGVGATVTLPANSRYSWRIIAISGTSRDTSLNGLFGIDTASPSVPARISPINGHVETSAQVRLVWSAATDSALANAGLAFAVPALRYYVELSRNSGFSSLIDSASTSDTSRLTLLTSPDTGTFFWRVRSQDSAGNLSAWGGPESFTRPSPHDTAPPLPPFNLAARVLDTGAVLLTWDKSPSTDVDGYAIYWNGGADTFPSVPLGYFVSDGRASFIWLTDSLAPGLYGFRVQAVDHDGFMDRNATVVNVRVNAPTETNILSSEIITPQAGKIVNRTGGIEVVARIIGTPAQLATVTQAIFQFRVPGGAWTNMAVASNKTNPVAWKGNGNVSTHWEADALPLGTTEIRVVPMAGSVRFETGAARITITLNDNKKDADISNDRNATADSAAVSVVVNTNRTDTAITSTPSGRQITVVIPTGVAPGAPDTNQVRLEILIASTSPVETSTLSGKASPVGFTTSVSFSNLGQPGGFVDILLPLPDLDANNTILLNGRRVPVADLQAWTWSSDTGRWERLDAPVIDLVAKTARLRVRHFSFFTLAAPVLGVTSLSGFQVFPVPFVPNDASADNGVEYQAGVANTGITFRNIPASSRLKIFDPQGTLVAEVLIDASGGAQWDVKNGRGDRVASGVYVFIVTSPSGERRTGKLVVIR